MSEERRREACLTELHHCLADGFVLGDECTDTDAAFAVSFRHAVHQDDVVLYALQMAGGDIRRFGVDELAIDLVGDEIEVVFLHQVTYLPHLLFGVEVACGVVGVADEDSTCLGSYLFLELLDRRQFEAVLDIRLDGFDHGSAGDGEGHVVGVGRVCDDNLVAGVETAHISEHDCLRTAGGDDDLVGREVNAVIGIVTDHLCPQRFESLRWRIGEDVLFEVPDRFEGLRRCLDIRLSDIEVIDMHPCQLGFVSVSGEFPDRALGHGLCT